MTTSRNMMFCDVMEMDRGTILQFVARVRARTLALYRKVCGGGSNTSNIFFPTKKGGSTMEQPTKN